MWCANGASLLPMVSPSVHQACPSGVFHLPLPAGRPALRCVARRREPLWTESLNRNPLQLCQQGPWAANFVARVDGMNWMNCSCMFMLLSMSYSAVKFYVEWTTTTLAIFCWPFMSSDLFRWPIEWVHHKADQYKPLLHHEGLTQEWPVRHHVLCGCGLSNPPVVLEKFLAPRCTTSAPALVLLQGKFPNKTKSAAVYGFQNRTPHWRLENTIFVQYQHIAISFNINSNKHTAYIHITMNEYKYTLYFYYYEYIYIYCIL